MADYATDGSRIVAIIVDLIILSVVSFIIALPFGTLTLTFPFIFSYTRSLAPSNAIFVPSGVLYMLLTSGVLDLLLMLLYFTYFEGTSGQTLGKKIKGIKVVKENGDPPSLVDALIRTILRIIDGIAFYLVGFIVIQISEKKQRLGDKAAGTIVVNA